MQAILILGCQYLLTQSLVIVGCQFGLRLSKIGGWWCRPTRKSSRFVRACRAFRACGQGEAILREGAGGVFGLTLGVRDEDFLLRLRRLRPPHFKVLKEDGSRSCVSLPRGPDPTSRSPTQILRLGPEVQILRPGPHRI